LRIITGDLNLDEPYWLPTIKRVKKENTMAAFTVRLPDATADKLDELARKVDRSRSYMAVEAIEDYLARQEWQLAEIEAGLAEAGEGDFANDDELARVVAKYVKTDP
jgi:predicted transcriptional regulator